MQCSGWTLCPAFFTDFNHWVLVLHWDPCQLHLLVSQIMLKWNQSALDKVRHRNSCCFVTSRTSGVSEEGGILKEVNTQGVLKEVNTHGQVWFCPKASTASRMRLHLQGLAREQLQRLGSLNCIADTEIEGKSNNWTWRTWLQQVLIPQHLPLVGFQWNQGGGTSLSHGCFGNVTLLPKFLPPYKHLTKHTRGSETGTILLNNPFLFICPFLLQLMHSYISQQHQKGWRIILFVHTYFCDANKNQMLHEVSNLWVMVTVFFLPRRVQVKKLNLKKY